MRILVTGGAGFIGSHTSQELLRLGHDVTIVDDLNDYYSPRLKERNLERIKNPRLRFERCDICSPGDMRRIFSSGRFDSVIHLAARAGVRPSIENPMLYARVNVLGTINLLELAREFKTRRFIFASSSSVYGANDKVPFSEDDPIDNMMSPYAITKRTGEQLCRGYHDTFGIDITCLRFFTVYGPFGRPDMAILKFAKNILQGKPIERFGDGTTRRDYTYISDIVTGIVSSMNLSGFEILNLGDNNPVELNKLISLIEKNLGKKAKIAEKPLQKGDVPVTYADIAKAKRLISYEPKIKVEEGIRNTIQWLKSDDLCLL